MSVQERGQFVFTKYFLFSLFQVLKGYVILLEIKLPGFMVITDLDLTLCNEHTHTHMWNAKVSVVEVVSICTHMNSASHTDISIVQRMLVFVCTHMNRVGHTDISIVQKMLVSVCTHMKRAGHTDISIVQRM